MATLYRKTAKGQTEIETRVHRLLPRLRTALILVDGKRNEAELRKLVPADADEALRTLLADAFIEAVEVADKPAARAAPAPAAAPAATPAGDPARDGEPSRPAIDPKAFEQHRRSAVRTVNDALGPVGEVVAIKLEKSRTWSELTPALQLAQRSIANVKGDAAAAEFGRRYIDTLPV
jgi:hypothetical protein